MANIIFSGGIEFEASEDGSVVAEGIGRAGRERLDEAERVCLLYSAAWTNGVFPIERRIRVDRGKLRTKGRHLSLS